MGGSLVLKAVQAVQKHGVPTLAEKLIKLSTDHPHIKRDNFLAFPTRVIHCLGPNGETRFDIFVMRNVPGMTLAEVIARKWEYKEISKLMQIFEQFGARLGEFHTKYGDKQHGDLQPSNVFYDEASGKFTLIDVGDIGGAVCSFDRDVDRFLGGLSLLAKGDAQLYVDGRQHFEAGYSRAHP